jgi:L(+)-tartrate dehydratase beta subunit
MATYTLNTPLSEEVVRKLKVRDTVLLNGTIFGIRDLTLIHIFDKRMILQFPCKERFFFIPLPV